MTAAALASVSSTQGVPALMRLPSDEEIRDAGESFLAQVFGPGWETRLPSSRLDALLAAPIDHAWLQRRIERLRPMSNGPMDQIPKPIWDLSTALSQHDWFELWKELALRCPREWLVQFCGVAVLQLPAPRPRGKRSRSRVPEDALRIASRRVQSMLSLGVLAWLLAKYDPTNPRYPYVIRGLPYGAWQHLVAYWERYADRDYLRVPGSTTLFGTYAGGGRWDCGYIESWCQTGIAIRYQPAGKDAAPGMAGPWRKTKGEWQRWAFVEVRLKIEAPHLAPAAMGPSPSAWRKLPPPPATGEFDELVTEPARSWYSDEEAAPTDRAELADSDADSRRVEQGPAASAATDNSAADERTAHYEPAGLCVWRASVPSPAPRPLPASEWRAIGALVDEFERSEDGELADSSGGDACCDLQEPAREASSAQPATDREQTPHDPEPNGLEVWRAPEPSSAAQPDDERRSLEATELASREIVQWLRARRPGEPSARAEADVVAACTLEAGAAAAAPADKFVAALQAYQAEKDRRAQSRADQRKRKPPW